MHVNQDSNKLPMDEKDAAFGLFVVSCIGILILLAIENMFQLEEGSIQEAMLCASDQIRFKAEIAGMRAQNNTLRITALYPIYLTAFPPVDSRIQNGSLAYFSGRTRQFEGKTYFVADEIKYLGG